MVWKCAAPLILLLPLYVYPQPAVYSELAKAGASAVAIVTGPNSGPPDANSRNITAYNSAFQQLTNGGVQLAGYVYMSYAQRPVDDTLSDIRDWYAQHGDQLAGIFVDEAAVEVTPDVISYYTALRQEVKSHGAAQLLIVNPGVVLDKRLSQLADVVLSFENNLQAWNAVGITAGRGLSALLPQGGPKTAAVVHSTGSLSTATLQMQMLRASLLGYSYAYFTDGLMPNPYGQLPSYFEDELAALQAVAQL